MSLKMSRRGFVKATAAATASTLLLGSQAATAFADDAAGAAGATASDDVKKIPSACRQCYGRCALFGHVKDGRVVKIEGNPDLFSEGTLCSRAFAIPQELYNPLRVRYPQKRVGEKGPASGSASRGRKSPGGRRPLHQDRREHGWHIIAHQYGTGRDMLQFQAIKAMLELGSTATFGAGNLCCGLYFTSQRLYGDETVHRLGRQQYELHPIYAAGARRGYYDWLTVKRAQERGAKVICVDPRYTCTASKADLWLPIRPGSDMALVLAFINEIIHSDKCAEDFARFYTNAPFFIDEEGTGYQLRESMIKEGGNEELYPAWDEAHDQLIFWSGDWQNKQGVGGPKAFQWLDAEGLSWRTRSRRFR
ncbi:MAG: molybdopterin-dependent oxidoreductase [Gordonibacter urolithinfaciens]